MASGRDEDSERFADAWDDHARGGGAADARGSRRTPPDLQEDLDVAALLREAGRASEGPDPAASARMRAGLMDAITGGADVPSGDDARPLDAPRRTGTAGAAGGRGAGRTARAATRPGETRPGDGRPDRGPAAPTRAARRRAQPRRASTRLLTGAVGGMCTVLVLAALTVVLSRGALPGEMLYGLKRASESVELGLTNGQEATGRKHLEFAASRLEEVSGLISRDSTTAAGTGPQAAGLDPAEAVLVSDNLRAFDEQARAGTRLMLPLLARPSGPSPDELAQWAREQSARLQTVGPSLPDSGRGEVSSYRQWLDRVGERAAALEQRRSCPDPVSGEDELGPLPGTDACPSAAPAVETPSATEQTSTSSSSSTSSTTSTTTTTTSPEATSTSQDDTPTGDGSTSGSNSSAPLLPLPSSRVTQPPSVNVPAPVPGLPKVDLPPLLPGLPGISLG